MIDDWLTDRYYEQYVPSIEVVGKSLKHTSCWCQHTVLEEEAHSDSVFFKFVIFQNYHQFELVSSSEYEFRVIKLNLRHLPRLNQCLIFC